MNGSQSLFVCGIASIFICFAHAQRPQNPQDALGNCFRDLGTNSTSGGGLDIRGDNIVDQIKRLCRPNEISEITTCLRKMFDECENTKYVKELKRFLDVNRWKETSELLCNNKDYINQNIGCLRKNQHSEQTCTQKAKRKLDAKYDEILRTNPDEETLMEYNCRMFADMLKCMRESHQNICPEKLLHLMKDLYYGYGPPRCYYWYRSYAVVKSGSVLLVCVAAVVATFSGFLNMI